MRRPRLAMLLRPVAPTPQLSRWDWAVDAMLAFALTVGTLDSALQRASHSADAGPFSGSAPIAPRAPVDVVGHYGSAHWWQILLALAAAAPLVARRRYPLAVCCVVITATLTYHRSPGFDATFTFIACVLAAYSATLYSPYQVPAIAAALVGAVLLVAHHTPNVPAVRSGLTTLLFLVPVALAANTVHGYRKRVRAAEAEREAAARVAADRERARIAQELHDVVTHNVSVMVVQAGAARKVLGTAPAMAEQALLAVESGGRAAMTELRHVMGLLAPNGGDQALPELSPAPGLEQIGGLAARVRDTGVPVELTVTGTTRRVPAGVDLAAYRVVQEALTNAVKHSAGAGVHVVVDHAPGALRVEVTDAGGTPAATGDVGSGRGLIGLSERLAVLGGSFEAGPVAEGGFRVRAIFPVEATP